MAFWCSIFFVAVMCWRFATQDRWEKDEIITKGRINKFIKYLFIFILYFNISFIVDIFKGNLIFPWNGVTTYATINYIDEEIEYDRHVDKYWFSLSRYSYKRDVIYTYVVDGVEYRKIDELIESERYKLENINESVIEVTYDKEKPENVIIGKVIDDADIVNALGIISLLIMLIIIKVGTGNINDIKLDKQINKK